MSKVEMLALRRFPRMDGQAILPIREGETFMADEKEVAALSASGKAKPIETKPAAAPGKKGS